MARFALSLFVALAGCAVQQTETSEDHGHDATMELVGSVVSRDLSSQTPHRSPKPFVRVGITYDSPLDTVIEVSTSADGETWTEWSAAVLDTSAEDPEWGRTHAADHDVAYGEARFARFRAVGAMPSYLGAAFLDADDVAELELVEAEGDLVGPMTLESDTEEVSGAIVAHSSFVRYRFDQGRVGRAWLWLLRSARHRGWTGRLAGPRTGLRTYAQQASLWRAYQNGTGAPAFPPWGPSRHLIRNVKPRGTWYQAVDTQDVSRLVRIARGLGVSLHVPYSREPWHVEARRSFGAPRGWRP